jgi:hypothetical protein
MQPTAISVRPHYLHRLHRTITPDPCGRAPGTLEDALAPARGIMIGIPLSAVLWAGIIAALTRFLG